MINSPSLSDRHVLVVGGAGYVGTVLVQRLLAVGAKVRVLDCFLYGHGRSLQGFWELPGFSFVYGDLCSSTARAEALDGVTDVVLLASLVGDPISKKYPELTRLVNGQGSRDLFDDLNGRDVRRFIFTSTCSNYGLRDTDELATEDSELAPLSLYAETKVELERYILSRKQEVDFDPVILRISTAFGTSFRMRFDLTVNEFVYHLARGESLDVYDRDTWRPYCHTRDIAAAIIASLQADAGLVSGEVFNVGRDDNNFTKQMIVDEVAKHIPVDVNYVDKGFDRRNYRVSFEKIRRQLGFKPEVLLSGFVPVLIQSVRSGVFPDVSEGASFYGNHVVTDAAVAGSHNESALCAG